MELKVWLNFTTAYDERETWNYLIWVVFSAHTAKGRPFKFIGEEHK